MKIDYEFTVGVPVDQAWDRMLDLEKIAPCLPGAAIQEEIGDGEYAGTMKVQIGPITVGYKGTVKFEATDESDHRAVLEATGRETRGQGTASATIVSTLREEGDGTRVNVETDLVLTGRIAQFGRGIAQGVAKEMLDEFAACLEREISGAANAEEAESTPERVPAADGKAAPAARTSARMAGGTVEGAVVAGSSPSEAAEGAPTTPTLQPAIQAIPRRDPQERSESFDLDAVVRDAIPAPLALALSGLGVLLVLLWLLRKMR
ncbi:MAG TPA: SRPBCC family protein [Rubrobacter sp.]|nr:SRPBCC family protein [Rubrobacter sp.]